MTKYKYGFLSSLVAPANPDRGDKWYDESNYLLKWWNGTSWVVSGAPSIATAWTPGAAVSAGDLRTLPDETVGIRARNTTVTTGSVFDETEQSKWARIGRQNAALAGLAAVRDNLAHSDSVALCGLGDSTIAGSSGVTKTWLRVLADKLATRYVNYRVRYWSFNVSTTEFESTTVQASPSGDRAVVLPGAVGQGLYVNNSAANAISTAFTLEVDLTATSYASGSNQAIAGQFGSSGSYGWLVYIGTTGLLNTTLSTSGTNQPTGTSTTSLTTVLTAGQRIRLRVTFSGTSNTQVAYYYSTNGGGSYTQLGTTVTVSGSPTTLFATNRNVEIGAYNNGASWQLAGSIYEMKLRSGIATAGQNVMPALPDHWSAYSTSTHTFAGSPTIDIYAAAAGGYSVSTLVQYQTLMLPPHGHQAILVDCLINQGLEIDASAWAKWSALLTYIRSTCPSAGLSMVIPNPERQVGGGVSQTTQDTLRRRAALAKGFAQQNALSVLDVQSIFLSATDYSTFMQDDRHPNDAGHALWASYVDWMLAS